jgi:hypothetical protein
MSLYHISVLSILFEIPFYFVITQVDPISNKTIPILRITSTGFLEFEYCLIF